MLHSELYVPIICKINKRICLEVELNKLKNISKETLEFVHKSFECL